MRSLLQAAAGLILSVCATFVSANYCSNMKAVAYMATVQRDAGVPEKTLIREFRKKNGGKRNQDLEDLISSAYMARGHTPESFATFFYSFCKTLPGN